MKLHMKSHLQNEFALKFVITNSVDKLTTV